jgi:hypothetical protein
MMKASLLFLGMAFFNCSSSFAATAPKELFGKTVRVSFAFGGMAKGPSGRVGNAIKHVELVIYISAAGRIFARASQQTKEASALSEQGPEDARWHFAGNKLVVQWAALSGANMATVAFDPSFQSCTYSAVAGHESGKPYKWKGLNGKIYESVGPLSASESVCTLSAGNGL